MQLRSSDLSITFKNTLNGLLTTGDFFSPHRVSFPTPFNQDLPQTNCDGTEAAAAGVKAERDSS